MNIFVKTRQVQFSETKKMKRSSSTQSGGSFSSETKKPKREDIIQVFGYTNNENPFNDSNLSEKFVWNKKEQIRPSAFDDDAALTEAKQKEILLLKQQRIERDLKKQEWESERERVFREREAERFDEYEQKEVEFHLKQENLASFIRLREKRPRLIDYVTNNLKYLRYKDKLLSDTFDDHLVLGNEHENIFGIDHKKPYELVYQKGLKDLLDSKESLETMIECDTEFSEFWNAFNVVTQDAIKTATENEKKKEGKLEDQRTKSIHDSVVHEIKELLSDKTLEELVDMEKMIDDTLDNRDASTDVEYWEGLKKYLQIYKARNILDGVHKKIIEVYEELERQGKKDRIITNYNTQETVSSVQSSSGSRQEYSNQLSEEDRLLREFKNKEAEEGDEDGIEEVKLVNQQYAWNDKYRPRKPKYFNRVRTGFEWTKYNRTHYDTENPPPKVIQGYKFNIFYPDLIDKSKTPSFTIERGSESDEFCTIRFHAGPPYEDISFRVVNREWEKSYKRGYRCVFERGVLQLHFKFRKLRSY